jgi:hypothetical protein
MTVAELIKRLTEYDPSLEVVFDWEGGHSEAKSFEIVKAEYGNVLSIDVDDYGGYNRRHQMALGLIRDPDAEEDEPENKVK